VIDASIDRFIHHIATQADRDLIAAAPMTIHHGQRDPHWRTAATPPHQPGYLW
jgi:hypothetical protein